MKPFVDKFRVFRRIALLWAMGIITYATVALFSDVASITGAAASAYATVAALMSTVVGFYTHTRAKEET